MMQGDGQNARMPRLFLSFAHPDDESFCAGGTIARATAMGFTAELLCATRGEEGEIAPDAGSVEKADLGTVRERELRLSAEILGIRTIRFLGYRDGTLADISRKEGTARVRELMESFSPDVVITFGPDDGLTGHLDHRTIGRWTTDAFGELLREGKIPDHARLYWVTISREGFSIPDSLMMDSRVASGTPAEDISTRVDTRKFSEKKRSAILAHVTQRQTVNDFAPILDALLGEEFFRRVVPVWKRGDATEDWIWHNGHES